MTAPAAENGYSKIGAVASFVDAATQRVRQVTRGLSLNMELNSVIDQAGDIVDLHLDDLRAVMERLADVCPEHGSCSVCKTALCEPCQVGLYAACGHQDSDFLCEQCAVDSCPDCRSEQRAEHQVDRYFRSAS